MKIVLMVNSECNAKCKHCYVLYTSERSPEDTLHLTEQLVAEGHEVIIAGKETLLDPDYLKAYQAAGNSKLLSNGIILADDPSMCETIKAHNINLIAFSLHFGIQDDLKSVPRPVVERAIKNCHAHGIKTQVSVTITTENYMDIESMCDEAVGMSVSIIQFLRFVSSGKGADTPERPLDQKHVDAFFAQIMQARKKYPKDVLEIRPHGNWGPRPGSKGAQLAQKNQYCPSGVNFFAIDPDNNIFGCPFAMQKQNKIGKLIGTQFNIHSIPIPDNRTECICHLIA